MFVCIIIPIKLRDESSILLKIMLVVFGFLGLFIYSLISDMARQLSQQPAYLAFVDALKHSHSVQMSYLKFLLLPSIVLDLLMIVLSIILKEGTAGNPLLKVIVCAAIGAAGSMAIMDSYGVMDTGQVNLIPKLIFIIVPAIFAAMAAIDLRMLALGIEALIMKIIKR